MQQAAIKRDCARALNANANQYRFAVPHLRDLRRRG